MAKIETADDFASLTEDKYDGQKFVTNEMSRIENLQNTILANSGKVANTLANGYRSTAVSDQTNVMNNSTANLYASKLARQNSDIVNNQVTSELADIATENTVGAIGDVGSFFTKGVGSLYNLENYKRKLALKEAQTVFDIKKGVAELNLGWADYDLNSDRLDFTKETNLRNEALTAVDE